VQYASFPSGAGSEGHGPGQIKVLSLEDGQVVAAYRLVRGQSDYAFAACANTPNSFLFVRASQDQKLQEIRYAPRVY
jgi:hypothetical protein